MQMQTKKQTKTKAIWGGSTSLEKIQGNSTNTEKKWGDGIIQKNSNKNNPQVTGVLLLNFYNITVLEVIKKQTG